MELAMMDSKESNSASNVLVALDFCTLNWTLVGAAPTLGPSPLCQRWMTASNNGQMTIVGGDRLHQKLNDLYTCWCPIPTLKVIARKAALVAYGRKLPPQQMNDPNQDQDSIKTNGTNLKQAFEMIKHDFAQMGIDPDVLD